MTPPPIQRFSSRRQRLDRSFLATRLQGSRAYDRIAGYFSSSLLEVVGEELESVAGSIRIICNSDLHLEDVKTAQAAQMAVRRAWTSARPEKLLQGQGETRVRDRFRRLYTLLSSGKLQVRVLPDRAFGLIHGKAGVITLADGSQTCFIGSANESKSAWQLNYELVWEDTSAEAIAWVQEEFDALWGSPQAVPLAEAVIQDIRRLAERRVIHVLDDWLSGPEAPEPSAAIIETPVYRQEVGLWEHQKYFVKMVFDAHRGPTGQARFILADQVGLGKTLQLAMAAKLIALSGAQPILVICPKTLLWQWQGEMRDLLDMPSAVWDGRRWVDEQGYPYPAAGPDAIRKCPRRVGIVSGGLISHGSGAADYLLTLRYDCVILDEAHRARRRNLGQNRDQEAPEPNNLLRFMYAVAERSSTVMLATATPVQLRPVEAWDLLDVLSRGDESVLGNAHSRWRHAAEALDLVMKRADSPADESEQWEWMRNPFPPKSEHYDFEILRRQFSTPDEKAVIPGNALLKLSAAGRQRLANLFPRLVQDHNPFIRRIVRRTRQQLEAQIDPETNEPFLKPIAVELLGEEPADAIRLPAYLRQAYEAAEEFCTLVGQRMKGSGFLKTLLLRRVGSSIYSGLRTAERMLGSQEDVDTDEEDEPEEEQEQRLAPTQFGQSLTEPERDILRRFVASLRANQGRDPKYAVVVECLRERGWLERGCIIFSQYRDSIQWLAEQLTREFPEEPVAVYSGPATSGIMQGGKWTPAARENLKQMVRRGELHLLLGTDAASEGLNLQSLSTLINLDLPWNPTRLEQRKGRIQRIGQIHDTVQIYNMRYQDSVEDRVHQLLSSRLQDVYNLFGQIPDVLEDVWVKTAEGEIEEARKIIDALPKKHPFEVRYTTVEKVDWETCRDVLDAAEKYRVLSQGW
ncbi:MAG: phospholipase D-like domain-containing protein [Chloroflexi bacterium]|nr:phospholipase D-like domain-containing protein [Chloroflexota bacterium]